MTFSTINTNGSFDEEQLARLTLVACDQSYKGGALGIGEALALLPDSPGTPYANTRPFYENQIASSGFVVAATVDHPHTGFKAVIYKNAATGEVMVAFGGTDGTDAIDWQGNFQHYGWNQWDRGKAEYYTKLNAVLGANFTGKLHFTGQSLGGALAQYAAYEYVRESTCTSGAVTSRRGLMLRHAPLGAGGAAGRPA
jgi:hypothetical protein